jgi:hypothetical protein
VITAKQRLRALLTGREAVPEGFTGRLQPGERVIADAETRGGVVLATDGGLWVDDDFTFWHQISKATWAGGSLELVVADDVERWAGDVVLLADRPVRRVRLTEPGKVPEIVHRRVTGSIRSREHHDLPGGGAWFVQRRVGGAIELQVRPDPGTDPDAVRILAEGLSEKLRTVRP